MKIKSIKPINRIPHKGIYTKTANYILTEFQRTKHQKAEVNVEEEEENETLHVYNAMKSLIRRKGLKIDCSIDMKAKKLFLSKNTE